MSERRVCVCQCDDPDCKGMTFRVAVGEETKHVYRDVAGYLWVFCSFHLVLARFEDDARRVLDHHWIHTSDERPNYWGDE